MVSKIIDLLVLPVMRGKNVLELINEDTQVYFGEKWKRFLKIVFLNKLLLSRLMF